MADRRNERRGLGRGLSALMADIGIDAQDDTPTNQTGAKAEGLRDVAIDLIKANPNQPRRTFDDASLGELASSSWPRAGTR